MSRSTLVSVLLASSLGCAIGELPGAEPADGGLEEADDDATPLTTGADDGSGTMGDGAGDGASDGADDGPSTHPADDGSADTGGVADDDGGESTGAAAQDEGGSTSGGVAEDDGGSSDDGATTTEGDAGDTGTTADAIDLSGHELVQTASARVIELPAGTMLAPGAYLVVGRNATRAQFEAFWGPLPADAVYIDSAALDPDEFPTINGDETYELRDPSGTGMDGPSAPVSVLGNLQRLDPGEPAALPASWLTSPDPNGDATPGAGQVDSALYSGVYVSEVSDTSGSGNYVYEFIELYHDP